MISYSVQRATVEDLVRYAYPTDQGTYMSAREVDLGSAAARASLETVEGMVSLHKWFDAFSQAFTLMTKFDTQVEGGTAFNYADWRLMDESVTRVLQSLREKLATIAE